MSGLKAPPRAASDDAQGRRPTMGPITDVEFQNFQDLFYRRTGISFGASKRYFVDRRLAELIVTGGFVSPHAYLQHLRTRDSSGPEMQKLINAMTVNETYFNREEYQFRCLISSILPLLTVQRTRPIRLWCLPCATGEEPYSIAIHMLEHWADVDCFQIEIVGSDIDTRVLNQARVGIYEERALHLLPEQVRARYFHSVGLGRWQIIESLRDSVEFTSVNLADRASMRQHRDAFDVIFCRNLLIYFDDASRRLAAEALFDSLRPGGFICLGHSESMSRMSQLFTVQKFPDAMVYRKPQT